MFRYFITFYEKNYTNLPGMNDEKHIIYILISANYSSLRLGRYILSVTQPYFFVLVFWIVFNISSIYFFKSFYMLDFQWFKRTNGKYSIKNIIHSILKLLVKTSMFFSLVAYVFYFFWHLFRDKRELLAFTS